MLFNSFPFIFVFLPVTLIVFITLARKQQNNLALVWLLLSSLFFYGWWNPIYLILITSSIVINFLLAKLMEKKSWAKHVLIFGVFFNLGLLGYFKYGKFFVDNINHLFNVSVTINELVLPLAISFFTFQQIAFLVDTYYAKTYEHGFLKYSLFVSFFPQLVAGPIVRHQELINQFDSLVLRSDVYEKLAKGFVLFSIGLIKKVIIAGALAEVADPLFFKANAEILSFSEAWLASLAYTFQIYFDFSGYSDMAIGLALMFGFNIPNNFDTPYRATSIRDFWRKWHMTLSRFLRDYLYIPLGGSRNGFIRQSQAVIVTMLLGGLWHGASWNFVAWGGLHGLALWLNQIINSRKIFIPNFFGWSMTFIFVLFCWVLFRAESFTAAMNIYQGLFAFNGLGEAGSFLKKVDEIALAAIVAIVGPSSFQWIHHGLKPKKWIAVVAALLFIATLLELGDIGNNEFIYFQF